MDNIRILFMGTPELSAKILEGLISNNYQIIALIAQKDKLVGRKGIIEPVPTKKVAIKYNIPVFQPEKIRLDYEFVKELNPDLIITAAYGQIIPQGLLDIPRLGCVNVHGSLLPKYRGASPIQSALIHGDKITGVTIMEMIDKMDAGRMMLKESFPIEEDDNYTSLCDKIALAGLNGLLKAIPQIITKDIPLIAQDEEQVSFCKKIKSEDEHLNLNQSAEEIINWIRALSFTPGGHLYLGDQIFKIYKAKKVNDMVDHQIGEIVSADKKGLILQVSDGQISLLEVQRQGKKRMDYKSFINGEKNLVGKILK